jgi:hypothetical protein
MKRLIVILLIISHVSAFTQPNCSSPSLGYPPINDLGVHFWRGKQGGLYPNGLNTIPSAHFQAGMRIATLEIKPLDRAGNYDSLNGKIVLLSIGMSNATMEFSKFMQVAFCNSSMLNPQLKILDGAKGAQALDAVLDSNSAYWEHIAIQFLENGVSKNQVQIVWFKQAEPLPTDTSFPGYSNGLKKRFEKAMNVLKNKFPNLKQCYISSRIYAGYASFNLNPEPFAYYSGWAVKWMIEDQINGDTSLSYSGKNPKSAWLAWGPYTWADGSRRRSDGLSWNCSIDYMEDGTHPTDEGRLKVANMLFEFFKNSKTTKTWFSKN